MQKQNKGFTLIELLVVVLIIGILSAVALPQYKIAVIKGKLATVRPLMKSIYDAREIHYMAQGEYTYPLTDLDIDVSQMIIPYSDNCVATNGFVICIGNPQRIDAMYCPTVTDFGWDPLMTCWDESDFIIHMCQKGVTWCATMNLNPGETKCEARTDFGRKICQSAGIELLE